QKCQKSGSPFHPWPAQGATLQQQKNKNGPDKKHNVFTDFASGKIKDLTPTSCIEAVIRQITHEIAFAGAENEKSQNTHDQERTHAVNPAPLKPRDLAPPYF